LQKANADAERRYEKLLRALENGPEIPESSTSIPSDEATKQFGTLNLAQDDRSTYTIID
jgi:hypothetical protein